MRGKDEKGSALIWAMMFVLIISILITSGLSIGLSFISRSATAKQEQQVYYTARSIAKSVTDWLQSARLIHSAPLDGGAQTLLGEGDAAAFIRGQLGAAGVQGGLRLPLDMGDCELTIEGTMESDITVTVRAALGNETHGVRSYLRRATEFTPGTPAYTPPEPPPGNPPPPPEWEALPQLSELTPGELVHSGIQLEEEPVEDGLTYLYPFELRRSEPNILVIDGAAQSIRKGLIFRFSGDHSPRFPPTILLTPAAAQEGAQADELGGEVIVPFEDELPAARRNEGATALEAMEAAAPDDARYEAQTRVVGLEGSYRSFHFYTGAGFSSPLALGPVKGQPDERGNRLYYNDAAFVIEQGAEFRVGARAGLRGGEIVTHIPTFISGAMERSTRLTVHADVTTFAQEAHDAVVSEAHDAIVSPDGAARDDSLNNPRALAPFLSEDSAILVKGGAVLRISAGEFLGNIYVEAGGRLEIEGAPVISGGIYLYAPEEGAPEEAAQAEGAQALLPAQITGDSEGLTATVYAHPDALIDPAILDAGRITYFTKYFLGEEEEQATPGTPDITTIYWTDPVFMGVN